MEPKTPNDIERLFEQGTEIDQALSRAARKAREDHRSAGLPLPVWRDGKTVWMSAEELDDQPDEPTSAETR
jgi:hypothetical protein